MKESNWELRLREFFETGTARRACSPLQPGASVILVIKTSVLNEAAGDDTTRVGFLVSPKGTPNLCSPESIHCPQAILTFDNDLTEELLRLNSNEIADYGILILGAFLESPRRLQVKLQSGFFELWRKGWFGVLALGGAQLTRYLATHGLDGIGGIQRAIHALRSKNT